MPNVANEGLVQIAGDGAGKKIRNLLLRGVVQPDGTTADVYVQCATIVDADGHAISLEETNLLLRKLVRQMRALRLAFVMSTQREEEIADDIAEVGFLPEDDDEDDEDTEEG